MLSQNEKEKSFKKYQNFKTLTTRKYYKGLHKIIKEFELK